MLFPEYPSSAARTSTASALASFGLSSMTVTSTVWVSMLLVVSCVSAGSVPVSCTTMAGMVAPSNLDSG